MEYKKLLAAGLAALMIAGCGSGSGSEGDAPAQEDAPAEETKDVTTEANSDSEDKLELTGNTEDDYKNAVDFYSKKFAEAGDEADKEFLDKVKGFDGDESDLFTIYQESIKPITDVLTASGLKFQAILGKDDGNNEEMYNEYSEKLNDAYKEATQKVYADYTNALADLKS